MASRGAPGMLTRPGGSHEHARQGAVDGCGFEQGERVFEANQSKCGAVDRSRTLATHPQRRFPKFSAWQGPGYSSPFGSAYWLTAVFGFIPKNGTDTIPVR